MSEIPQAMGLHCPDVLCAVLAGGAGRRMAASGGGAKPFAVLNGRPLAAHVIARLNGQGGQGTVLNPPAGDLRDWPAFGLPLIADHPYAGHGPLAGLLAVMGWAAHHRPAARFVLSVPVDTPFLPADLAGGLYRDAREDRVVIARSGGRDHPVIGLWPVTMAAAIATALAAEERAPKRLLQRISVTVRDWPVTPYDPFMNINDAAGLERAAAILTTIR